MNATEVFEVTLPNYQQQADPLRREQWAFYCLLGELLKTHKGQYVAVQDRRVVASGPERMAVVNHRMLLLRYVNGSRSSVASGSRSSQDFPPEPGIGGTRCTIASKRS